MRRFEFKDGKSNKFWEIETRGSAYVTRHGRIGTDGRETSKPCGSPAMAERQVASAIASKLKKGYVEVDADAVTAPPPSPKANTPQAKLERQLLADSQAFDDWLVYADALTQAGDPRGELVNIGVAWARHQASGEKRSKAINKLLDREDELLAANAEAWFGKLASDDTWRECFAWSLENGFWGRIRFWVDYDHSGTDIPKALAYALTHPSAKFLRQLDLGLTSTDGDANYDACIRVMVKHGSMPSLRRMTIGDFQFPDESEISWVQVGSVGRLWALLPNLEQLTLQGASIDLGNPKSSTLKSLTLRTGGLPGPAGESLGRAELPALERLVVWFGTRYYNGSCTAAHVRGILTNPKLANLRHLALANADFADDIAAEVARLELPKTLTSLDLSMGTMTDSGAGRLLKASKQLARLEQIDLSSNYLSQDMCDRLARELGNVLTDNQKQGDGEDYYVSVGE